MSESNIVIKRRSPMDATLLATRLHPVLARLFAARNIKSMDQLEYSLKNILPFHGLKGIDRAVSRLVVALEHQHKVIIVGDFDADGATSTALGIQSLALLGYKNIGYLVPNRFKFGYGLTPEIVDVASQQKPDLIITVDNGISSIDGVVAANQLGIDVIITDHHLAGKTIPDAIAIVNPNQPGCEFASKNLPGVGVIFYVMLALRAGLRELGWFKKNNIAEPNFSVLLDLLALGIVADVVPLDYNNRILVSQGMARIRAGKTRPGIKALLEQSKRNAINLAASDLGFAIAPRINAAGRLDDMSLGIECLLANNLSEANQLAKQLNELNLTRRSIEDEMKQEALQQLEYVSLANDLPIGLCLFEQNWHEGVVGIVASRLKDKLHRPVIAFAQTDNGELKGSARSVKGVHIRDVLDAIATRHPDLIKRFGGHAMAAGLSLPAEHYPAFSQAFDEEVRLHLDESELQGTVLSDGALQSEEIDMSLAELVREAGPWGQGFDEPVFDGIFNIVQKRIVGEKHLKLVLCLPGEQKVFDAIAFNVTDEHWPDAIDSVQVAYRLDINEFRGERNVQLMVQHIEPYPATQV